MKTISGRQVAVVVLVPRARRQLRDLPRRLDAGEAGHADVEEDDVGAVLVDQLHRLQPVARLGHDLQLGPDLGQARAQLLAHQAFVVGQHGARCDRRPRPRVPTLRRDLRRSSAHRSRGREVAALLRKGVALVGGHAAVPSTVL